MFNHGSGQGFHQYHQSTGMEFEDILRNMFGGGFGNYQQRQSPDINIKIGIKRILKLCTNKYMIKCEKYIIKLGKQKNYIVKKTIASN